jgi:hypothetical protein
MLLIPVLVDMYNLFMGGVDIADQRRSYWPTQLRVSRNWLPLFFWYLETAIVNAFILYRIVNITTAGEQAKNLLTYREFIEKLYQELIAQGSPSIRQSHTPNANIITRKRRISRKHTNLPPIRLQPGNHEKIKAPDGKRGNCSYCCWSVAWRKYRVPRIYQSENLGRNFRMERQGGHTSSIIHQEDWGKDRYRQEHIVHFVKHFFVVFAFICTMRLRTLDLLSRANRRYYIRFS